MPGLKVGGAFNDREQGHPNIGLIESRYNSNQFTLSYLVVCMQERCSVIAVLVVWTSSAAQIRRGRHLRNLFYDAYNFDKPRKSNGFSLCNVSCVYTYERQKSIPFK